MMLESALIVLVVSVAISVCILLFLMWLDRLSETMDMKTPLSEFTTDGCSGGMSWIWRKLLGRPPPWEGACVEHDKAYWKGGDATGRRLADLKLASDVSLRGYPVVGALMYYGVRFGGVPWLPTSWRWGYGYGRKIGRYGE